MESPTEKTVQVNSIYLLNNLENYNEKLTILTIQKTYEHFIFPLRITLEQIKNTQLIFKSRNPLQEKLF